ncbi:MAG: hypothetical protein ABIQ51_04180 [Mesorhizobium sp.]|uniref:hypothetical protein n=1 Tax=Mesorhizobium sp. INR15 TaxID=2654248 RepID=UPI001896A39E|nr:hypothetical protein [Mesorhizobium sp. INR15]QPC95799.1 hypothetical protein GA829_35175 [Mesorhizobium sp. INR15]
MAVAKKEQERDIYAAMYGAQARKDGKDRAVPGFWQEQAGAWLDGFDGKPTPGSRAKPVGDQLEAELGEAAVSEHSESALDDC